MGTPACGSSSDGDAPACEAGRTLSCACPGGGETGVQTCSSDGSGWSSCDCTAGGAGGTGAGGSGGEAGTGAASGSGGAGGVGGSTAGGAGTGGASGGASGGAAGSTGNGCPTGRGSEMVRITHSMGDYCIDKTEATKGQYAEFRAAMDGDYSGQPDYCSWNTDYSQGSCGNYSPNDNPSLPAGCMDWCDADQFCRWAGKRLCGALGGGANLDPTLQQASEWSSGCSAAGPVASQCVSATQNPAEVSPGCPGSHPGFADVTHLIGNVSEWAHECGVSAVTGMELDSSACNARGGSIADQESELGCHRTGGEPRTSGRRSRGTRCCATAVAN